MAGAPRKRAPASKAANSRKSTGRKPALPKAPARRKTRPRRKAAPRRKTSTSWPRRLLRAAAVAIALALAVPPLQVLSLRFVDPPTTGTRVQRGFEALAEGRWPRHRQRHRDLEEVSPELVQAVLISEDQRFYLHDGFDLDEVEAALEAHRDGGQLRGASTLTMQCARTVFLWQGRSWTRKGLEAVYTLWMELLLPKERILELYLDEAEWGPSIFGAEAAARHRFACGADDLDRAQACALAAVLPDPVHRDPRHPSGSAQVKAAWIFRQMDYPLPHPTAEK